MKKIGIFSAKMAFWGLFFLFLSLFGDVPLCPNGKKNLVDFFFKKKLSLIWTIGCFFSRLGEPDQNMKLKKKNRQKKIFGHFVGGVAADGREWVREVYILCGCVL